MIVYKTKEEYTKDQGQYIERMCEQNSAYFEKTGKQRTAFVHNFGCQQNVADGEIINGQLSEMGFGFTLNPEDADFILFNTCAVRDHAEKKIFSSVGEIKAIKKANPNLVVGLCGCMTQQEHVVEKIKKSYPYVDMVFGTHAIHKLPYLMWKAFGEKQYVTDISSDDMVVSEGLPTSRNTDIQAWVSIMYGCNNYCTYCIVPYVRGRERSREKQAILNEIQELVSRGYKEFTLLGQNVNSYGKTLVEKTSFAELLREINELPGDFRIRFMTSHPKDATRQLIDAMRDCEKVVRFLHLPVQSGNNRVLHEMNRKYTVKQYLEIIDYAKEQIPDITFTSDIIVGFPGESYNEFLDTLELVKRVEYNALYTYIYSKRTGTKAAEFEDIVPYKEKSDRLRKLIKVQDFIGRSIIKNMIGEHQRVLVLDKSKNGDGKLVGRNDANMLCEFEGSDALIGEFVLMKVEAVRSWTLLGSV